MIIVSDETKRWKLAPFENAGGPGFRAEAMPPRLAVPCRPDENSRGVVAFDVIEKSIELIEVGKDEIEETGPALGEKSTASVLTLSNLLLKRAQVALWSCAKRSMSQGPQCARSVASR